MQDYIAMLPNEHEKEMNFDFLSSSFDKPLDYYVIAAMKDLESIENIELLKYEIVEDQDEVDINQHMININFKKKDLDAIPIPKHLYMFRSRYHEIKFTFRVFTNLNEKVFVKRILVPTEHDGLYLINDKRMKIIWQMVDASTYSRRGQITMKSRMPIMVYCNKHKIVADVKGREFLVPIYSHAQDYSKKKRGGTTVSKKKSMKFINPIMIYIVKLGLKKTVQYWGMDGIVLFSRDYSDEDEKAFYIFECNEVYIKVYKDIFDKELMVQSFVGMFCYIQNRDFPVTMDNIDDKEYWTCRIGYVGSAKNKNLSTFYEKGRTSIHMFERLLDTFSMESLRLPDVYKSNIYHVLYWMITNFDEKKKYANIDMNNKRIRKNEVVVSSTLGRKIAENVHKLIERKTKSKMNNMETLLEVFNFNSDIIFTGIRNMNDIVKSDDLSNDMTFMNDFAFTNKGSNSLGEGNSKNISDKYRYLHPSMVGKLDLFTTSNSDCGMSGSIVPFVKLYDGFFFTPEGEPCTARYEFEKRLQYDFGIERGIPLDSFESYIQYMSEDNHNLDEELKYEPIIITEKEPVQ